MHTCPKFILYLTENNFNEINFAQGSKGLCNAENAILNNPKGLCRSKRTTFLTRRAHNARTTPAHNPKGLCRSKRTILLTRRAHNPCAQPPRLVRTMKFYSVKYSNIFLPHVPVEEQMGGLEAGNYGCLDQCVPRCSFNGFSYREDRPFNQAV